MCKKLIGFPDSIINYILISVINKDYDQLERIANKLSFLNNETLVQIDLLYNFSIIVLNAI